MVKDSDILIMDEPESGLDESSIHFLYKELKENFDDKIVIVISHSNNYHELTKDVICLAESSLKAT